MNEIEACVQLKASLEQRNARVQEKTDLNNQRLAVRPRSQCTLFDSPS